MNTIFENAVKAAINEKQAPLISPEEAERQGFAVPQNLLRWEEGERSEEHTSELQSQR